MALMVPKLYMAPPLCSRLFVNKEINKLKVRNELKEDGLNRKEICASKRVYLS